MKIDIEDDGSVFIATDGRRRGQAAPRQIIEGIAKELEVGDVFTGKVVRIMPFGAFVEYAPGKDGMIHISKLANEPRGKGGGRGQHRRYTGVPRGGDRQRRAASTSCATTSCTTTNPCPCAVPRAATATAADAADDRPRRSRPAPRLSARIKAEAKWAYCACPFCIQGGTTMNFDQITLSNGLQRHRRANPPFPLRVRGPVAGRRLSV